VVETCGLIQKDGVYYLNTDSYKVPTWRPASTMPTGAIGDRYLTCGDNSHGTLSVCRSCVIRAGLIW